MSIRKDAEIDPVDQFWEQLDDIRAVLLGVPSSGQHLQPMAPNADRTNNAVWFFTNKNSDLLKAAAHGAGGQMIFVNSKQNYFASAHGDIKENKSPDKIDQFWSPIVAAWYPEGKEDPSMTLLEMRLEDAAIWAATGNPAVFAWEIAKANMTGDTPDVGHTKRIRFGEMPSDDERYVDKRASRMGLT